MKITSRVIENIKRELNLRGIPLSRENLLVVKKEISKYYPKKEVSIEVRHIIDKKMQFLN